MKFTLTYDGSLAAWVNAKAQWPRYYRSRTLQVALLASPIVERRKFHLDCHVRFTSESGHCEALLGCPLCAKSGHEEGDFLNLGVTRRNGRGVVMGTQVIGVV
jgi:hypothetical protein